MLRKFRHGYNADDSSPHSCKKDIDTVMLKANPKKFHLILSGMGQNASNVDKCQIFYREQERFLSIKIDNRLHFDTHMSDWCRKASQNLHQLARVSLYINNENWHIIMQAFINMEFGYCQLIWMFRSRNISNKQSSFIRL